MLKTLFPWLVKHVLLFFCLLKVSKSKSDWCDNVDSYPINHTVKISSLGDGISMGGVIICGSESAEDQRIILTIIGPSNKWFGIPFGTSMLNDAVIYTTGKDGTDEAGLYDYDNTDRTLSGVKKDELQSWTEISNVINDGKVTLIYSRLLDTGDSQDRVFTGNNRILTVMYAIAGSGLQIRSQHAIQSDKYYDLNFITGTTTSKKLSKTKLKQWHGGIMWFAWNLFAYTGVIAARYKDHIICLVGAMFHKQKWFWCHISCMVTAAILTITGFIIAVVSVDRGHGRHFDRTHTIIGLVILILVIFQPLNAIFRPHKQENVERQSWPRRIWELIHRNTGRAAVILSVINVFTGMVLLDVSNTIIILQIIYICLLGVSVLVFEIYVRISERRHKKGSTHVKTEDEKTNKDEKPLETEKLRGDDGEGHHVELEKPEVEI